MGHNTAFSNKQRVNFSLYMYLSTVNFSGHEIKIVVVVLLCCCWREDGLIAYVTDFVFRSICIETYFILFLFDFIFDFFKYVFSFIGLNLSHRNQKVSMVHTEFFGRKSRTFQGLKLFFQGLLFPNNMK